MERTKQFTEKRDCGEQQNLPPGGRHATGDRCPVEGTTVNCDMSKRPPEGVTVEQPAGRAEAQSADSTCNNKHLNLSVSKTRATGGITRGILDTDPDTAMSLKNTTTCKTSRTENKGTSEAMWSSVKSAMLNCHDNVTEQLRCSGINPVGDIDSESIIWRRIQPK